LSGWGLRFFDYDNDGALDLFLANGHPDDMIDNYSQQVKYKEPLLLFHQQNGQFHNVSAQSGPAFSKMFPARGLAIGDFNNDGRIDVLIGNNGGPPVLLRNNGGQPNHWLGVALQGTKCNRDAVGARLTWSAGGVTRSRLKNNGGSYLSSHDMREVLGVGPATKIDWLEVQWPQPSGRKERFTDVPLDRYVTIVEGQGIVSAPKQR
jgi:predicted NUDIX family NTP pyrophosphohydrolase